MIIGLMRFRGYFQKTKSIKHIITGKNNLIINTLNHIKAFQTKLLLFESQLKNNNIQHFPLLKELKDSKFNNYIKYAKVIKNI